MTPFASNGSGLWVFISTLVPCKAQHFCPVPIDEVYGYHGSVDLYCPSAFSDWEYQNVMQWVGQSCVLPWKSMSSQNSLCLEIQVSISAWWGELSPQEPHDLFHLRPSQLVSIYSLDLKLRHPVKVLTALAMSLNDIYCAACGAALSPPLFSATDGQDESGPPTTEEMKWLMVVRILYRSSYFSMGFRRSDDAQNVYDWWKVY